LWIDRLEPTTMKWKDVKGRLGLLQGGHAAHFIMPRAVVEIEPDFVLAGRFDGSARWVEQVTVQELGPGAFVPQADRSSLTGQEELQKALCTAAASVGNGNGRTGLLVPDGTVRVAILEFEVLPDNSHDAEQLVMWKMRELLPFPPAEARLSYQVLREEPGAIELLVVVGRNSALAEYETILEPITGGPNLILPATMGLLPLVPPGEVDTAQLLVHICAGWMTTVIVAGDRVRFWRNRAVERGTAEEFSKEIGQEVGRVQASCRDHLKLDVARIWLCARPPAGPELGPALSGIVCQEVRSLEPPASCLAHLSDWEQSVCGRMGAPLAGLLANVGQKS
jgi:hypothetical protein